NLGKLTVALDVHITPELRQEGIARELVNRLQNLRKEKGLEVTDRIQVTVGKNPVISDAITANLDYIRTEILADTFVLAADPVSGVPVEIDEQELIVLIEKV